MKKLRAIILTVITVFGFGVASLSATSTSASAAVNNSAKYATAANLSKRFIGTRYVWGGTTPCGFDCSGFVQYVFRTFAGVNLPRTSQQQVRAVQRISVRQAKAGDLVFWQSRNGNVYHVGISLGNGNFISALNPRVGLKINSMYQPSFAGRVR